MLSKHHTLYSNQCKAEYWEEVCAKALTLSGSGSDWKNDWNHKSGVDQTTNNGVRISNKSGSVNLTKGILTISGPRLTSHTTLEDKITFINNKTEDYIFCLATNKTDWSMGIKRYYLTIIESAAVDYSTLLWEDMIGKNNKITGHKGKGSGIEASIHHSMSSQLWTAISLSKCALFKEITIV